MKMLSGRTLALFLTLSVSGCGIGGHWMTGNPFYADDNKAYINFWKKQNYTKESRMGDWLSCGGNGSGSFSWKTSAQLPNETSQESRRRQEFAFQKCMLSKGYSYSGDCSSQYMRARPLCGGD